MTRITSITPVYLIDQHLNALIKELPRVFTKVRYRIENKIFFDDIPENFTFGKGHVKFFYDKLLFIEKFYSELIREYNKRYSKKKDVNILMQNENYLFCNSNYFVKNMFFDDFQPSDKEVSMMKLRLTERIIEMKPEPLYYRKTVSKKFAVKMVKEAKTH